MKDVIENIEYTVISGAFGGGGKQPPPQYTPIEADDTLSSRQTLRVLFAVTEGEAQSLDNVYVNNSPISNFNATVVTRAGLSSQEPIGEFSTVETPYSGIGIASQLLYNLPYSRAVSSFRVDGIRITLKLNSLQQRQANGDLIGYEVNFDIYTRKHNTDFWTFIGTITKKGKASQPYSWDTRINKPVGGSVWEFRIIRTTPDDTSTSASLSFIDVYTEIQDAKLPYNNTGLVGIIFNDSRELSGAIPTISFEVHGRKIKVPTSSVYDAVNRTYSSPIWDGTPNLYDVACNCPAWILYDMLTDPRVGLGNVIHHSDVDRFSFFELAKYCDELIDDSKGGLEHRFSFNNQFYVRENASTILTYLLAICNANLITVNGLISVTSDRPTIVTKLVNNSNVIDGDFTYSSSESAERYSSVNVTFNNPDDRYNTTTITEIDNTLIARYGLQTIDIVLVGCTSEAQARRKARWVLRTPTDILTFKNGFEGMNFSIGEVINVLDDNSTNVLQQGLIKSASTLAGTTTIILDRILTFGSVSNILTYSSDVVTIYDTVIDQSNITTDTITMTALTSLPNVGSPYIIKAAIIPRPWKVSAISVEDHIHTITCTAYDEDKFVYIDSKVTLPSRGNPYLRIDEFTTPAVTNINFNVVHIANKVKSETKLVVHWDWNPPASLKYNAIYSIFWRRDNLSFVPINDITAKEIEIHDIVPGIYEVIIYAYNIRGIKSAAASQSYSYRTIAGTSTLLPPVQFYVKGTTSRFFTTSDLALTWAVNPANADVEDRLQQYQLETWSNDGATKLNTYIVKPNAAFGGEAIYTLQMNRNDYGIDTPNRNPQIKIYSVDLVGDLSKALVKTFSNAAPVAPSFSLLAGLNTLYVNITPNTEIDLKGYIVYVGQIANFNKADHIRYDGPDPYVTIPIPTSNGIKRYVAVACYDSFGKTGLNISTEQTVTPLSLEAINWTRTGLRISVNNITHTISWTAGIIYEGSNVYNIGEGSKIWTTGTLYLYFNPNISTTALQTTTTLGLAVQQGGWPYATYTGGDMTTVKGGDGKAFISGSSIIAGTVGAAQLIAGSAVITGAAQIANAIINNAHIQDGAIDNAKIGQIIQSTDFSDQLHKGWRLDKAGNLKIYGSIDLRDNSGNAVLNANIGFNGVYIQNATIDGVKIKDASITNAKIGNLAVDTLQLAGNAVTVPVFAYTEGNITGQCNGDVVIQTARLDPQPTAYRLKVETYCQLHIVYHYINEIPLGDQLPGIAYVRLYGNGILLQNIALFASSTAVADSAWGGGYKYRVSLPPYMVTVPANTLADLKFLIWFPPTFAPHNYSISLRSISALGIKR